MGLAFAARNRRRNSFGFSTRLRPTAEPYSPSLFAPTRFVVRQGSAPAAPFLDHRWVSLDTRGRSSETSRNRRHSTIVLRSRSPRKSEPMPRRLPGRGAGN